MPSTGSGISSHLCPRCKAARALGEIRCSRCGAEWIAADVVESARAQTAALVESLRGDPYLRSAGLLAYTLRSHVRGFLDDPTHPLARALLQYLHTLVTAAGPAGPRQLAPHAERAWVAPESPVLARSLRYLRERFARELDAAARDAPDARDFETWHRALPRSA